MERKEEKQKVINLRKKGKTYSEIKKYLKKNISKSTLSYWCKDTKLPINYYKKVQDLKKASLIKARKIAWKINNVKRKKYLDEVINRNKYLTGKIEDKDVARIALAILYLCEGSKKKSSLMFGNSDPFIIKLFLRLIRYCYDINEKKFRCTLQCRADQDIKILEKFWSRITNIPLKQFYKAQVDYRTINKPSRKPNYKGVCRIDYFSSALFIELKKIGEILFSGS